jgi:hypothetical protein
MNAYSPPIRQFVPPTEHDDACCDLCCATPVHTELDGDRMCQSCADKWARNEDDPVPMDDPAMQEALREWHRARGR